MERLVQTTTGNTSQIHVVRLLSSDPGRVRTLSRVLRSSLRSIRMMTASVIETGPELSINEQLYDRTANGRLCSMSPQGMMQTASASGNNALYLHALRDPSCWHRACSWGDMKLTQPILKSISHQLCHGNPWWAIVVLNEYLEPASPLHVALMRFFWRRVDHDSKLAHRLKAGALYRDLSPEERTLIGSRVVTRNMYARAVTKELSTTRNHTDRRPPLRRAMRSRPTMRAQRPRNQSLQPRGHITSTMSPAAPALRVVQGVARTPW